MPLQNRVTPFGTIEDLPGRGTFLGNRGCIHEGREIRRQWASKAWITCVLEFKGWKAPMFEPNRWTPLFFLDGRTLKPLETGADDTAILEGTTVKLKQEAADLLNQTFGTDALKAGFVIGVAKITVNTA